MNSIVKTMLLACLFIFGTMAVQTTHAQSTEAAPREVKKVNVKSGQVHKIDATTKVAADADGHVESIKGCKPGCEKACCAAEKATKSVNTSTNAVKKGNHPGKGMGNLKKACAPGCTKACCVAKNADVKTTEDNLVPRKVKNADVKRVKGPSLKSAESIKR